MLPCHVMVTMPFYFHETSHETSSFTHFVLTIDIHLLYFHFCPLLRKKSKALNYERAQPDPNDP